MPDLFASVSNGTLTLNTYLICTACAFICGIIAALAASFRSNISKSFLISLILLPTIVQTVIIMVNGNVGTGIAVAGAFSLVRFRSVPGKAKEIAAIFLTMTAGLACAAGYVAIAILFTAITSAAMLVITLIPVRAEKEYELRITVPESPNYTDAFEDLFEKYTKRHRLCEVRTTNMGSLYRLTYKIEMNASESGRAMIDALRCRNGNLEIRMENAQERSETL